MIVAGKLARFLPELSFYHYIGTHDRVFFWSFFGLPQKRKTHFRKRFCINWLNVATSPYERKGKAIMNTTTQAPETEKPWFKSPLIVASLCLSTAIIAAAIYPEFNTQRVIHYRADDNSLSADRDTLQRKIHCQLASQHYKPGDIAIAIPFADRPQVKQPIDIFNSLTLMGECQKTARLITNQTPGTSLILLLEKAKVTIQEQRKSNPHPGVFTIIANDFEPGPGLPELNWSKVNQLVDEIGKEQVVISVMMPINQLYKEFSEKGSKKVILCPLNEGTDEEAVRQSISPCIDQAFTQARQANLR